MLLMIKDEKKSEDASEDKIIRRDADPSLESFRAKRAKEILDETSGDDLDFIDSIF